MVKGSTHEGSLIYNRVWTRLLHDFTDRFSKDQEVLIITQKSSLYKGLIVHNTKPQPTGNIGNTWNAIKGYKKWLYTIDWAGPG